VLISAKIQNMKQKTIKTAIDFDSSMSFKCNKISLYVFLCKNVN